MWKIVIDYWPVLYIPAIFFLPLTVCPVESHGKNYAFIYGI